MLDGDPALLDAYSRTGRRSDWYQPAGAGRALLERGADVNAAARSAFRVAPVHAAAAVRDAATMTLLLDRGADANARQQLGYTALHTAAQLGDDNIIDLLLAHGADPRAAGDDGKTPSDLAAAHGQLKS
jgi:ankyrin repeat protein